MDIDKLAELAQAVIDARDTKRALTVTDHSVALNRFEQAATPELIIAVIVRLLKAEALLSQKEIEFAGALERTRTLFKYKNEWADRARKAESQLAELAKQKPMAYRWEGVESGDVCYDGIKPLGVVSQPLYASAAPPAPFVDPGLLAQFNRHRLLQIIVTGPDASGAEQNTLARIALAFYPKENSGSAAGE